MYVGFAGKTGAQAAVGDAVARARALLSSGGDRRRQNHRRLLCPDVACRRFGGGRVARTRRLLCFCRRGGLPIHTHFNTHTKRLQKMPQHQQQQRLAAAARLAQLYAADRLLVHTLAAPGGPAGQRRKELADNGLTCASLLSASLLFGGGGVRRTDGSGGFVPNAVARPGDEAERRSRVFATLHDLELVWLRHAALEEAKQQQQQVGEEDEQPPQPQPPLVLFSNADIGARSEDCERGGRAPPCDYRDVVRGAPPLAELQRERGFDFRRAVAAAPARDDPRMEQHPHAAWNELRCVLDDSSLVGLLYIHDPDVAEPSAHAADAARLLAEFHPRAQGAMGVFRAAEPSGATGSLLLTTVDEASDGGGVRRERLVLFEEYAESWRWRCAPPPSPMAGGAGVKHTAAAAAAAAVEAPAGESEGGGGGSGGSVGKHQHLQQQQESKGDGAPFAAARNEPAAAMEA